MSMKTKVRSGNQPPLPPPFIQGREAVHRSGVALTFRSAGERNKSADASLRSGQDLKVDETECGEQSENVYENKGRGQNVKVS
jgi:hypothetical protein